MDNVEKGILLGVIAAVLSIFCSLIYTYSFTSFLMFLGGVIFSFMLVFVGALVGGCIGSLWD